MAIHFSVVIPTLNEEKFLPNLLSSLADQTVKNFDVTVVDGSSKDKTVAIAKTYAKKLPKLTIIVSEKASLPLQRNMGAAATSGEWLVFVDADSILLPHFIERIGMFIRLYSPKLFTTWWRPDSENAKDAIYTLFGNIYLEASIILHKPVAPGPLSIIRRNAFDAVGGYDEKHAFHEDIDLGLRLHKQGVVLDVLRESLCIFSLRRFRREGTLKVLNQYIISLLPVLFTNTSFKWMPGYVMGGQAYRKKKGAKKTTIQKFEQNLKKLLKEIFE